jgi:hypothetical protein
MHVPATELPRSSVITWVPEATAEAEARAVHDPRAAARERL